MNWGRNKSGGPSGRLVLIWATALILTAVIGVWAQAGPEPPPPAGEALAGDSPAPGEKPAPPLAPDPAGRPARPGPDPNHAAGALNPLFMEPAPEPAPNLNLGWELVKTALALILVVGLIVFGLKAGLRLSPWGRKTGSGRFKLEGVMPLDNRKYLAAVDVDGRRLILGVTPERVDLLTSWAVGGFGDLLEPTPGPPAKTSGKEERLDQA